MMVFTPAARVRLQDKFDCERAAGEPLQVAIATPDRLSVTVPVKMI